MLPLIPDQPDVLLRPLHHLVGLRLLQLEPAVLQFCGQTFNLVFQLLTLNFNERGLNVLSKSCPTCLYSNSQFSLMTTFSTSAWAYPDSDSSVLIKVLQDLSKELLSYLINFHLKVLFIAFAQACTWITLKIIESFSRFLCFLRRFFLDR